MTRRTIAIQRQHVDKNWPWLDDTEILAASDLALEELKDKFSLTDKFEKLIQCFLFGYFIARRLKMQMEYGPQPNRRESIDFRFYDKNQALLELATIRRRVRKNGRVAT